MMLYDIAEMKEDIKNMQYMTSDSELKQTKFDIGNILEKIVAKLEELENKII